MQIKKNWKIKKQGELKMNNKTKNMKILYKYYIGIGLLYVVVKIIFVSLGYLHPGAILHGVIPGVLTISVGFLSLRKIVKNGQKMFWHKTLLILPLLIFIITPVFMYFKMGAEEWLINGRLPVLIIYEILAIIQLVIAFIIIKQKNETKTNTTGNV